MQQCGYCKRWFKNYHALSNHIVNCNGLNEYLKKEHGYNEK